MVRRWLAPFGLATVGLLTCAGVFAARQASRAPSWRAAEPAMAARADVTTALRNLPLTFERNDGQFSEAVRFAAVHSAGAIAIGDDGFTIAGAGGEVRPIGVSFAGARPGTTRGDTTQEATSNYYVGRDRSRWRTGIPTFERVQRRAMYRHVDVVYYGNGRHLEYDMVVAPGGDPRDVRLQIAGAAPRIDRASGELVLQQGEREIRQQRPVAYQTIDGERRNVTAHYVRRGDGTIGIDVAAYDDTRDLIIDPVVVYTTYIAADDFTVDRAGNVYFSASTTLPGPVPHGFELDFAQYTPNYDASTNGVFIARLSPDGTRLLFSTFIAADTSSVLKSRLAIDPLGTLYVSTYDGSGVAPATTTAATAPSTFVAALDAANGQLQWGTYVGRFLETQLIAAFRGGGVAIAGKTTAPAGVARSLPIPPTFRSDAGGSEAWVVTLLGGIAQGATYFGGSGDDEPTGLAAGPDGSVYLAGTTHSRDLPLSNATQVGLGRFGGYSAFLARLNVGLTGVHYSTYLGGNLGGTSAGGLAVDATGAAYLAGFTFAEEFPVSAGRSFGQCADVGPQCGARLFLAKFQPAGGFVYASRLVFGSAGAFTVDPAHPFSTQLREAATAVTVAVNGEPIVAYPVSSSRLPAALSVQPHRADGPLHSFDGGRTFAASGAEFACRSPEALLFAPSNPLIAYAQGNGLCRSTDGGRTWQTRATLGVPEQVAISPTDPLLLLATTTQYGVVRSTDGGGSWTPVSGIPGSGDRVAFDPADGSVAYASFLPNGVYRSSDSGVTWSPMPGPPGTARMRLERVAAITPTTIFVRTDGSSPVFGRIDGTRWKSTDGGTTWQPLPPSDIAVLASDPTNGAIVYGTAGPGVCRSTDAGVTWPQCSSAGLAGSGGDRAVSLSVDHTTPSEIYGVFDRGVFFSVDSGVTWTRSPLRKGGFNSGGVIAADPAVAGHVVLLWSPHNDAGITRFNASGSAILFSTYFGGSGEDRPLRIETDASGSIYLYGLTHSPDLATNSIVAESGTGRTLISPFRWFIRNQSDDPLDYFLTRISPRPGPRADFDADGRTDPAIFRPGTGEWLIVPSRARAGEFTPLSQRQRPAETTIHGQTGDLPAAADFDGDGRTDLAVFRPSTGAWIIRDSITLQTRTVQWGGLNTDVPVPADYDGDGKADIAFWRPHNAYWYVLQSSTGMPRYVQWGGLATDLPAPGDYDGDGKTDFVFFRPTNGYWYLNKSATGVQYVQWGGTAADVPAPGDFDGDGTTDIAVWRPSDFYWYIRSSRTGANRYVKWGGLASDVPVPGDYDQDGITDPAFFRAGDGYWYILQSRTRTARYVNLGATGDIPIPSRR
jgi:hypothetical protein